MSIFKRKINFWKTEQPKYWNQQIRALRNYDKCQRLQQKKKKFIIGEQIGNFSRDMEIMEKTNKWKYNIKI